MTDKIAQYGKNVFTNVGQSDVDGFMPKLEKVKELIKEAGEITVYYGFHGNTKGEFDRKFDADELQKSLRVAQLFPGATMVQVDAPDDPKINYKKHSEEGQVLFTWCDSDAYIKTKNLLPGIVQ